MTLSAEHIDKIATLAKLQVEDDKIQIMQDLNKTLDMIAHINDTPTDNIAPLAHPFDEHQPLRVDAVTETDQRTNLQSMAPLVEDGFYLVPQVIEDADA